MNKKFWLGFVVVLVATVIMDFIVNMYLMMGVYEQTKALWRPEGEMIMWVLYVCQLFFAFFFTLIFAKWYAGKGVMEGLQYGFYVSLMMNLPAAYAQYATMPVPYAYAIQWFLYGTIEYLILGALLAAVFGKKEMPMTARKMTQAEAV